MDHTEKQVTNIIFTYGNNIVDDRSVKHKDISHIEEVDGNIFDIHWVNGDVERIYKPTKVNYKKPNS